MKEIKFRFWTPDKRMIDDHEGWVEGIGINEALAASISCGYVPMQYMGRKDRNGVDIYENDIVACHPTNKYGVRVIMLDLYEGFNNGDGADFEVIGNTFQNPELSTLIN